MFRNILLVIISIFFTACATWQGVKQNSKTMGDYKGDNKPNL